jgi:HPt (histidine-containing phosphotransfer) domain-containing protein
MHDADQQPVLDLDHLMTFTDGDMELENELSVLYLSSAEAYVDAMSRALGDGTSWTSSVHALKGASSNLGALRVAALARTAEHQNPDPATLEHIRRAIDEVGVLFSERQRALRKAR